MHLNINIGLNIYFKPILYLNYCNFKANFMLYFYFKAISTFIHTMLKLLGGSFPPTLYLFYIYFKHIFSYFIVITFCNAELFNPIFFSSEHYFKPILHPVISVRQGYFFAYFLFQNNSFKIAIK